MKPGPAQTSALSLCPLTVSLLHASPFSLSLRWQSGAVDSFHGREHFVLKHPYLSRFLQRRTNVTQQNIQNIADDHSLDDILTSQPPPPVAPHGGRCCQHNHVPHHRPPGRREFDPCDGAAHARQLVSATPTPSGDQKRLCGGEQARARRRARESVLSICTPSVTLAPPERGTGWRRQRGRRGRQQNRTHGALDADLLCGHFGVDVSLPHVSPILHVDEGLCREV